VSDNREFFSLPLKDAIRVVAHVAEQLRTSLLPNAETEPSSEEELTADHYLGRGREAMDGSATALQDYGAAKKYLEKAVAMGSVEAHFYLALLHLEGKGCPRSTDAALNIARNGGERGCASCYSLMWQIYAGRLADDHMHEANADLCFQWLLDKCDAELLPVHLRDYVEHSYRTLHDRYSLREQFSVDEFPGKHFARCLDALIEQAHAVVHEGRAARLASVPYSDVERGRARMRVGEPNDAIWFVSFAEHCLEDPSHAMTRVLAGIDKEDLEYCLPAELVRRFARYLPNHRRDWRRFWLGQSGSF
jgi:hypothetical protein